MFLLIVAVAAVLLWRSLNQAAPQQGSATGTPGNVNGISQAIAQYEGYYTPGSLPNRTNNPGDIGTFGGNVASYPDPASGFAALNNWISGHASANPNWDFYDMMRYYLTGDTMGTPGPGQNPDAYAEYVASSLGVDPTTPVSQVLGG